MGFVLSHPSDKNKYVARMGHPAETTGVVVSRPFTKNVKGRGTASSTGSL